MTPADLIAALRAQPDDVDRLMRAACAALRAQPEALSPPDTAALRAGLARIADAGLEPVLQRLVEDAPAGSATDALAALLRPPELAWDEAQEIDWAVRHWEACRAAGQLDEVLAADFGEYWRRLEWSALRRHLLLLGQGHAEERRLLAHVAKTSSRYVALAPLKRAMESRHPELFELGFSLR
ncbi:MAG: hypothetical protein IIA03_16690 [Proteobacteria bacterium]|jgi:hypothetical protein|nr:hypothetical protein [Methylibium sp.]MBY0367617.1 hypothetical protein [Burkholderiaceae bacterium]MCH8857820.1 hypothetical protein [Pseudomonadota bacterium]|mmetsp:Transcript_67526/g.187082  ORF Transcript_67526/g.187082 Transcript_67526/m.187082 type:complete len:182 (+) Transcript_67526:93-638(+)